MQLIWNENLRTGVREIDLQHEELLEIVGELEAAYEKDAADSFLGPLILRLSNYVLFHFETEEIFLHARTNDVEHIRQHIREHQEFADRVAAYQALASDERRKRLGTVLDYLKSWVVGHIMVRDKELARLMCGESLSPTSPGIPAGRRDRQDVGLKE